MINFKDHFSKQAPVYARYRPSYPHELYSYLSSLTVAHNLALDCATGNGQAAVDIASYFEKVIAIDPSQAQLELAVKHPKIQYIKAAAEDCPTPEKSVDLLTVASGIHWFDIDRFYVEAKRILKPNGIVAVWVYHGWESNSDLHQRIFDYEQNIVGEFWPNQFQKMMEKFYQDLIFPFTEIAPPIFDLRMKVDAEWVAGYLRSWSATQRYIEAKHVDPTAFIKADLEKKFEKTQTDLTFKLAMRVGRVD